MSNNGQFDLETYLRLNLPMVIARQRSKIPAMGRGWQNNTQRDPDLIFAAHKNGANFGLPLGQCGEHRTGLIDIECDSGEAEQQYQALWAGKPPRVPTYRGARGRHRLFRWRDGFPPKAAFHAGDLEIRTGNGAKGAQSIVPPSVHETGVKYQWEPGLHMADVEPGILPDEIVGKLVGMYQTTKQDHEQPAVEQDLDHGEAVVEMEMPVEERRDRYRKYLAATPGTIQGVNASGTCYRLAVKGIWGFALPEDIVVDELLDWGQKNSNVDQYGLHYAWSLSEIRHKVTDALKASYVQPGDMLGEGDDLAHADVGEIVQAAQPQASSPDDPASLHQQSKDKAKSRRRTAYSISQLAALPAPQWHIKGLFPQGGLVILWGQPGAGKTFVSLDWGLCTATGQDWLGRQVHQGPVVYIAAEGKRGFAKRCLRWCDYHNVPPPANFWVIPEAFGLIQMEELKELANIVADLGQRPAMIVIDTLNRNLGGAESSEEDMGKFIKAADLLNKAFDSTILIVHHTGWNTERERGHSSLRGAADAMISVTKMGERITDGIEIGCIKQKDADEFQKFGVACLEVGEGDESSVVLAEEIDLASMTAEERQERGDRLLCQAIKYLPADQYQAMTVKELIDKSGLTKRRCEQIIERAFNAGYILRVGLGIKGSPHTYYLSQTGQKVVGRHAGFILVNGA